MAVELFPLSNQEAEMCAIGSMILREEACLDVLGMLGPQDFYFPPHRTIFAAIKGLSDRLQVVDLVTLKNALLSMEALEEIGGEDYLIQVAEAVPSSANAAYYAGIVKDKATIRNLSEAGQKISRLAVDPDIETAEKLTQAAELLTGTYKDEKGASTAQGMAQDFVEHLSGVLSGEVVVAHPTGFCDIDRYMHGFQSGCFYLVAAQSGVGKSAFMLTSALDMARRGVPQLIISQEMPESLLTARAIGALAQISATRFRAGGLSASEESRVRDAADRLYRLGDDFQVYASGQVSLSKLRAIVKRAARKHKQPAVIWVDFIQLMDHGKSENRAQAITGTVYGLKNLALEMGCSVVGLSQVNREAMKGEDKRPRQHHIKDSSGPVEAADGILVLHRPSTHCDDELDPFAPDYCECYGIKNRVGEMFKVQLGFIPAYAQFVNIAE